MFSCFSWCDPGKPFETFAACQVLFLFRLIENVHVARYAGEDSKKATAALKKLKQARPHDDDSSDSDDGAFSN